MWKFLVVVVVATLSCQAFPRYHRLRREAETVKYGPCKNTYDQCPEWKGEGMCVSEQYKDYMMTVCPVTCEFCKENHVRRDEIDEPEETFFEAEVNEENLDNGDSESGESESGESEESGNAESGNAESGYEDPKTEESVTAKSGKTVSKKTETTAVEEEGESDSEEEAEEGEEGDKDDAEAVQPIKQEASNKSKGKISLLLKQNFKSSYKKSQDASFQMLEGNVKRDFEKALKGLSVQDISFSEGNIEGNPRQNGKTKVSLTLVGNTQSVMKKLTKMVDQEQSINGLSVVAGSLDTEDDE